MQDKFLFSKFFKANSKVFHFSFSPSRLQVARSNKLQREALKRLQLVFSEIISVIKTISLSLYMYSISTVGISRLWGTVTENWGHAMSLFVWLMPKCRWMKKWCWCWYEEKSLIKLISPKVMFCPNKCNELLITHCSHSILFLILPLCHHLQFIFLIIVRSF